MDFIYPYENMKGFIGLLFFVLFCFNSSKKTKPTEDEEDDEEARVKTIENGSASDGVYNRSFSDEEGFTQM